MGAKQGRVSLNWFERALCARLEVRVRARHCPEEPDAESARILSGIAEWCPDGIRHKADRRHVREAACLARRRVRRP